MRDDPYSDTHPQIHAMIVEGYRRMSPAQRLDQACALSMSIRELALLNIRRRHPDADAREQVLRLASRILPAETMRRACGWDVETMGY